MSGSHGKAGDISNVYVQVYGKLRRSRPSEVEHIMRIGNGAAGLVSPKEASHHVRSRTCTLERRVRCSLRYSHCVTCSRARVGHSLPFLFCDLDMANDYDIDATELLETYGEIVVHSGSLQADLVSYQTFS